MADDAVRADLVERLLDHLGHVCVTGEEGPIADAVEARYRDLGETVARVGNSVVVGTASTDRPQVVLAGHLDVVPPTEHDRDARLEQRDDGDVVVGRGASDMKSGNVVAMKLFEERQADDAYDVALVLYAAEEGPAEDNELTQVIDRVPWIQQADLAVILEPGLEVQVGCLGGLHAVLTFEGRRAHSARPWQGENALTKAGSFLAELHDTPPRRVTVDGIDYFDVWSATQAWTDNARNVVPGRFTVNLNFRFAPTRGLDEAEQELRELVADRAGIEIIDRAPPAPPNLDAPALQAFVAAVGDAPVRAKQAWTDVARFAQVGVPAVNYGPGLPDQAHQDGEFVPVANLVEAHTRLQRFLATPVDQPSA